MVALTQWEICQGGGGGKVEKYTKTNVKDPYIHIHTYIKLYFISNCRVAKNRLVSPRRK